MLHCERDTIQQVLEPSLQGIMSDFPKAAKVHIKMPVVQNWPLSLFKEHKLKLHQITIYPSPWLRDVTEDFLQTIINANQDLGPEVTVEVDGYGPIRDEKVIQTLTARTALIARSSSSRFRFHGRH